MSKNDCREPTYKYTKYFTTAKKKSNYFTIIFDSIIARTREARTHALHIGDARIARVNDAILSYKEGD